MHADSVKLVLMKAVRATRAAWLCFVACLSDRQADNSGAAATQSSPGTAHGNGPDLVLLAGLVLGGLVDPEAALYIAIAETQQTPDRRHGP